MLNHQRRLGRALAKGVWLVAGGAGCGPAPIPRASADTESKPAAVAIDPCAPVPGQPAPAPLARSYTGLARSARCQPEVISIMKATSAALGVGCEHCHVKGDFPAPTEKKKIADWMSLELAPRLKKHDGSPSSCASCHAADGKPRAKLLGEPRTDASAIEWMNVHMVADFLRADGAPLRCKSCHGEPLGAPGFQRRLIGTEAFARAWDARAPEQPAPAEP